MGLLWTIPLVFAVALVLPLLAEQLSRQVRLLVTRVALSFFGSYVTHESPRKQDQLDKMRAAHVGTTHRVYGARTLLYSALFGISGSIVGVYVAAAGLWTLRISGAAVRAALPPALGFLADLTRVTQLSLGELFSLLLFSSATVGAVLALGTYYVRWELLAQQARARGSEIEATLPRTIAFIYALSRSGMAFPAVLDTLMRNQDVYGEAATEIGVAVRDMNTFGTDVITALQRMTQRTPAEGMEEFGENLASVMGSGQSLSEFLRDQYERYQERSEAQQEQYLELLATFAEAYVTVLVAGPLFLITILVVVGLVLRDTLTILRIVVYVGLPLASTAFIVYVESVTHSPGTATGSSAKPANREVEPPDVQVRDAAAPDGGQTVDDRWQESRERLATYEQLEDLLDWLRRPIRTVLYHPRVTFLFTVPLALWWLSVRVGAVPLAPLPAVRVLDGPFTEAALFVLGAFAIVHEINRRRLRQIEAAVPDFLDRLASVNEAGMSVVESLERLTRSDLDALTEEVERTWLDVRWGSDVQAALRRMDRRIGSATVSRSVTLVANAMDASGEIAPVLEIAADEARASRRLQRERRQEMLTYLLVIYISFFVFLGIVVALSVSFIPAIESAQFAPTTGGDLPGAVGTDIFTGIGDIDTDAYTLMFFHASVIQALFSGLIAGLLGEGNLRGGTKHASILLLVTMLTFAVM